jgi:RHS repeat-associated protein
VYTTGTDTTPSDNTYQYTGRENDQNGLYYYRNRYLLPGVGAFLSEDPMGFRSGQNLNLYVRGNPVFYRDPTGLLWCLSHSEIAAISGGVGGAVTAGVDSGGNPLAIIGGAALGATASYIDSEYGDTVPSGTITGGVAGGITGGIPGLIGGGIAGGFSNNAGSNAVGGLLGGFVGGVASADAEGLEGGAILSNVVSGMGAGFLGGAAQDAANALLQWGNECGCQ